MYSTYPFNIRCARFIHASDTSLIPARSISSALPREISLRESFLLRLQFHARLAPGPKLQTAGRRAEQIEYYYGP